MSDSDEPMRAGERLSRPVSATKKGAAARAGQNGARGKPSPKPNPGKRKRRGFMGIAATTLVSGFYRVVLIGIVVVLVAGGGGFLFFSSGLPSVDGLKHYQPPLMSRVYGQNFQLVAELAQERRIYAPYDQIPPLVRQAFISAEDRNFWIHPGVDPVAITRAALVDMTRLGSSTRPLGASTITEQVVKNMLLDNRITFARKIKEAILALRVERAMTKKQILTLYLNEIYLGNNSYGVAAAAQAYFDKPLSQLDIAEAASLGGLPKAPTTYNPFLHPKHALDRRNYVISRMLADGAITQAQASEAMAEPLLPHAAGAPRTVRDAGYFADAVQSELVQRFGQTMADQGGLIVMTSLEPRLQVAAQTALRNELERYDHEFGGWHGVIAHVDDPSLASNWQNDLDKYAGTGGRRENWRVGVVLSVVPASAKLGWIGRDATAANGITPKTGLVTLAASRWARPLIDGHPGGAASSMAQILKPGDIVMMAPGQAGHVDLEQIPIVQGSFMCMDPRSGRILAMVGGWSHDLSPYNRAMQAERQPGSSVKPFDYLAAMQQGIQPDATVLDAPFVQQLSDGQVYRPGDYEDNFLGPVPIRYALEQSMNLATLHLVRRVGLDNVAHNLEAFGVVDHMPLIYPAAIGALDTTMFRMMRAYAALDEYGRQVTPSLIDSVTDPNGQVLYQAPDQGCSNCIDGNPDQPPLISHTGTQLADPDSVFQMITMMRGVVQRGTGVPAGQGFTQPIAGKTGTTNNFNDAWFLGFTPQMLAGCWVGFDTPQDLGKNQTGGNVCGPVWHEFMKTALAGEPTLNFQVPAGMTLQPTSFNGSTAIEAFKQGQSPGAQSTGDLLAADPGGQGETGSGNNTGGPAAPGGDGSNAAAPAAAPAQNIDKSLGGLY